MSFERAIDGTFIECLARESERGGWWADVLKDPNLTIAPRGKTLNVYWLGQAIFNVSCPGGDLRVSTHEKYLIDPELAGQVPLVDGQFETTAMLQRALVRTYEGPTTLAKIKKAASSYAGDEKKGCHLIAMRNANVIDVEIAFPGKLVLEDGTEKSAPRVDLASVVEDAGDVRLVFWEAKTYGNGELRAAKDMPAPVVEQIAFYKSALASHRPDIETSYRKVAKNLVAFQRMGWVRHLSPLIEEVGRGDRALVLGSEPKVGLLVFGFDRGQRDDRGWKDHLAKLTGKEKAGIEVKAAGDPKNISL